MKQRELFLLTIPVLMGYIPLGAAFGILAASKDFSLFEILLSSIFIYAGAGQFLLVALVAQNVSFLMIFFTLFLLNFRHFFYTLSLLKELKSINFLRHYIIFALTDESFALLSSIKEKIKNLSRAQRSLIMFEVCLLNQIYWVIGSVLGYYFKQGLNIDYLGVEFSLNALFIVLAYELYKQNPNLKILLYSSFVALFALFYIDKPYMLAFCIFIALMILIFGKNMLDKNILYAILAASLATYLTRVLAFILFKNKKENYHLLFVQYNMPLVIIIILFFYTFYEVDFYSYPYGLDFIVSCILVFLIHLLFKNALLSIILGTIFYMFVLRLF